MKECYACGRTETYKWYHLAGEDLLCGKCYNHYKSGIFLRQTNQVINRSCYSCGNDKPKGFWHINYDSNKLEIGALCDICFQRYFNRLKKISMRRKSIYLGFIPQRTNRCEKCTKVSNRLDGHHEYYFIIFPWAFRKYLCPSCHSKIGIELKQRIRDTITGKFTKVN